MNHNEAQIDFILESYAKDNPEEFTFVRSGEEKPLSDAEYKAAMESVLIGSARDQFLKSIMPSKAVLERAAALGGAHAMILAASQKKG